MSAIPNTEITVVFRDKEGDPICRMRETGRMPAPHDAEIHKELMAANRNVNAVIEVRSTNPGVCVVHLKQDKTIVETRESEDGDLSLWARKCPVSLVTYLNKEVITTKYPDNNVRVLQMTDDGRLRVHVISVSAQNGQLFFNRQVIIDTPIYQKDGKVVIPANPDITDKADTASVIEEVFADWVVELPDASSMTEIAPLPLPGEGYDHHGIVLWYSLAMGLGAIRTNRGDAKVHWTQVPVRKDGFQYLTTGERVVVGKLVPASKSAYALEAKGVELTGISFSRT